MWLKMQMLPVIMIIDTRADDICFENIKVLWGNVGINIQN